MTKEYIARLEGEIKKKIHNNPNLTLMSDEELHDSIESELQSYITQVKELKEEEAYLLSELTFRDKKKICDMVYESIRGLDVLGTIISDKSITEIMINGYDSIFVERKGKTEPIYEKFESPERLTDVITKFVQAAGRSVNESEPIVDTRLADGSRVNVVLPPIALNGPIVTIRRFPEKTMTVDELIERGSITSEIAEFLESLVRAKYNIFVSGGTGSGKTTFLNALSNFIPKNERIITIEDTAELQIKNVPNMVCLETRNANATGEGEITIRDLIKSSLRMRPERIIVGEVRGAEALDMLQAMNTGHDGSLSTGHANSPLGMLTRLETMVLSGTAALPIEAIRQQIASAVDIIIHLSRMRDFSRKTVEITEVVGYENGRIILNPLYQFVEDDKTTLNTVSGSLIRTGNPIRNIQKFKNAGIYKYIEEELI